MAGKSEARWAGTGMRMRREASGSRVVFPVVRIVRPVLVAGSLGVLLTMATGCGFGSSDVPTEATFTSLTSSVPEPPPAPAPVRSSAGIRAVPQGACDPSYPDVCIAPGSADVDCGEIAHQDFRVLPPDPHHLDGRDADGIGC